MKIKCCPACGSQNIGAAKILRRRKWLFGWTHHHWNLGCNDCYYWGPTRWTRRRAVRAWNREEKRDG